GEPFDRITFPNRVIRIDILDSLAGEDEIPGVNPSFAGLRFFVEVRYLVTGKSNSPKSLRRSHSSYRSKLTVGLVESYEGADIQIGNAIAVSEHENVVLLQPMAESFNTAAGLCLNARIYQMNLPIRLVAIMYGRFAAQ